LCIHKNHSTFGRHTPWFAHSGRMDPSSIERIHEELLQRFAGWPEHYTALPTLPDLALRLPQHPQSIPLLFQGDGETALVRLAHAWAQADAFAWCAYSPGQRRHWDPLTQSFATFVGAHADCVSYLALLSRRSPEALTQQLLGFIHVMALIDSQRRP